jgi:hypothetical protein
MLETFGISTSAKNELNVHTPNPIYLIYIGFSTNPKMKNMLSNKILV